MAKRNLDQAKTAKKDEFYTQLVDIEKELKHYRQHFKDKVVLCNCDDPRESNFFRYFQMNFEHLGLKKLIATCYKSRDCDLFSDHTDETAVYQIYEGKGTRTKVKNLKGDGDFRSEECLAFLDEADIVVTNPPFSLFREFVALLDSRRKKFLIIGNLNSISCKEIFPLVRDGKM